ncbi:hypothetical protein [Ensifer sp. YR511]|uniref:cucumopine synthase-related protein n=1 Tax=Ensifer sp. YR511 TaxID=1855294 RepID=UPI00088B9028|nr:hypothetical protein [Ensifer sp. YR511]SDN41356.1 hypothetical protein SAMN05216328_12621 [Ensifer sp. YR511]
MPSFETFLDEMTAATDRVGREEPAEHRLLRTGQLEARPGGKGSYFTTLDIAHGMLRDFTMYIVYPTLVLHRGSNDIAQSRAMVGEMFPTVLNYLGYSGFSELKKLGHDFLTLAPTLDHSQFDEGLSAYLRYTNLLYGWAYHWFPWDVGDAMRYADGKEASLPAIVDNLVPTDTIIRLRWEPIGIEVRAYLATSGNAELCDELIATMPFTCLQTHAMVAGDSLMAYSPLVSTAPTPFKEEIRLAPPGRLRFNPRTGQKFIVQYGRTTEDIFAPVIGSVLAEDVPKLAAVGAEVWESTYRTKKPIWLTVELD